MSYRTIAADPPPGDAITLLHGDCREHLSCLPDACVDAVITDPPYGLGFMGKAWDRIESVHAFQLWCADWADECLRVLKPGAHLLAFGGTRTYHRLAAGIEDAGFEVRDCLAWLYATGFPKSLDVSRAIDAAAGVERPDRLVADYGDNAIFSPTRSPLAKGTPVTEQAARWNGWGTALKPSYEPVVLARKPLTGKVAANVVAHGTGALNIDACRAETEDETEGRWPANVLCDEEAAEQIDAASGESVSRATLMEQTLRPGNVGEIFKKKGIRTVRGHDDAGGASRFYYVAKASRAERNAGLDGFEEHAASERHGYVGLPDQRMGREQERRSARNVHPTVKPISLMRWLVRLVTPPGGVVCDPFLGSGTTGIAAVLEARPFIGMEREADYVAISEARIRFWEQHGERGLDVVRAREIADARREAGQLELFEVAL